MAKIMADIWKNHENRGKITASVHNTSRSLYWTNIELFGEISKIMANHGIW